MMISQLIHSDVTVANEIIALQLGERYLDVGSVICEPEYYVLGYFDPELQGVSIVAMHDGSEKWIQELLEVQGPIGFFDTAATHPDHVGKGIATKLVQESLPWFVGKTKLVFATAWISSKGINIQKPLERNGFEFVRELPLFYSKSDDCPECNPAMCRCSSALYLKNIGVVV